MDLNDTKVTFFSKRTTSVRKTNWSLFFSLELAIYEQ